MRRLALLLACGCVPDVHVGAGDTDPVAGDTDPDADTGDTATSDPGDTDVPADGCRARPARANRVRAVVVAFPYAADGGPALAWEVLTLSADGELGRPGTRFTMGRAPWGEVAFSPDGSLGVVPQSDGSLGIFTLDGSLRPHVVQTDWDGDGAFYASEVVFAPEGDRAWIVDGNWVEHGGGIHEVAFDCETGAPTYVRKVVESKLAAGLHLLDDGHAVIIAAEVDGEGPDDAFLLGGWPDDPVVLDHADLFAYDDAVVGGHAVTPDGQELLVGDISEFSGVPNRVAFARIDGDRIVADGDLVRDGEVELRDPFAIVASPFGNAALVASGYGDTLLLLPRHDDRVPPFPEASEPDWAGPHPLLPGTMVVTRRGALQGLVLVSENTAVRRVRLDSLGGATDLGPFELSADEDDLTGIPGAIGVQP